MQTLYVLQGVPGSGKSTLAKIIQNNSPNVKICSTDDFHMENGEYKFKPKLLSTYHDLNLQQAINLLDNKFTVIVDNTNILRKHARPYAEFASKQNIPIVFIRVSGEFKNIHGVPEDKIKMMKSSMEDLDLNSVLNS